MSAGRPPAGRGDRPTRGHRPARGDQPARGTQHDRSSGHNRSAEPTRTARARAGAASDGARAARPGSRSGGARPGGRSGAGSGTARVVASSRPARKVKSVRGRRVKRSRGVKANLPRRGNIALALLLTLLAGVFAKLVWVQGVQGSAWAAAGDEIRDRTVTLTAQRGQITDADGTPMAFTIEGARLAVRPKLFRDAAQRDAVAAVIWSQLTGTTAAEGTSQAEIRKNLDRTGKKYLYLADNLMPAQADAVLAKVRPLLLDKKYKLTVKQQNQALNAVVTESQQMRQYPNAGIADPLIGSTGWDGHGLAGIESHFDALLAGKDGSRTEQYYPGGAAIPGTVSQQIPARDGSSVQLSIDADLQYTGQQLLAKAVTDSGAKGGTMVVLEADTGQVAVMASYRPGEDPKKTGNLAVSTPVEPGSVAKVVTMAAALDQKLITPDTVLTVPDKIEMGGITVGDAWGHVPVDMTATGILGKSSNVGTLMIAQKLGPQTWYDQIRKFGIGTKTGIQLNGESAGILSKPSQWSGATFANVPIGQGVAMTVLQLASMYQAIANDGVRVQPSIVKSTTTDGVATPAQPRKQTRAMSAGAAAQLRTMLTATVQRGSMAYGGTAPKAAIPGYQVAGKTGTAQQIDPKTKGYSQSLYTTTFAGMLPADNPRYVIAIALDRPGGDREGGDSAAPLFHDMGSYLMNADNVPPSATMAPLRKLYPNLGG